VKQELHPNGGSVALCYCEALKCSFGLLVHRLFRVEFRNIGNRHYRTLSRRSTELFQNPFIRLGGKTKKSDSDQDMRILMLLTDAFGGFGGISKFNRDFLTALDATSHVSRVYVWPRLITEAIEEPLPKAIVYERGFAAGKIAYLWRAAVGTFLSPRVDIVVCGHLNLLPLAWLVAKARGTPLALVIHGIDAWKPTRSALTNVLAGRVDTLISVSKVSADRFCGWSKLPKERVYLLPNCVDLDQFTPGPKSPQLLSRYNLANAQVLMTLGRLVSEERSKGFDKVLEAMPGLASRFPEIKYLIVGDGNDTDRLKSKAVTLGVSDRVVFTGRVPESEKVDFFRLADAYVMPSAGEGFGIVLIEAAACGIPVIGSRKDGSAEALLGGRLGRVVDPDDQSELMQAITEVLSETSPRKASELITEFSQENFFARVKSWIEMNKSCGGEE
jgi:phosphatidyl-myo-inositol dimannoside synthase